MGVPLPFSYPGSKVRSVQLIKDQLPPHRTYVVPFGGSGAEILAKEPSEIEIYNDINKNLYVFFCVLQDDQQREKLIDRLLCTPYSRDTFCDAIHVLKYSKDIIERAWAVAVTGNQCDIGRSIDTLTSGTWSCIERGSRWVQAPARLRAVADRLRGVRLENRHWDHVFSKHDDRTTLFSCDPPYYRKRRYYRFELSDGDHLDLIARMRRLRGKVIIFHPPCQLYDEFFADPPWHKCYLVRSKPNQKQSAGCCVYSNFQLKGADSCSGRGMSRRTLGTMTNAETTLPLELQSTRRMFG